MEVNKMKFPYKLDKSVNTTFSVDSTGRFLVFGGKKGLRVFDTENVDNHRFYRHRGSKEITLTDWKPQSDLIASTSGQDLLLWDVNVQEVIKQRPIHTRPVADLCWNPVLPNVLASCSADAKISLWDIREDPRTKEILLYGKGGYKLSAGVTRIKWNRLSPTLLASTCEGTVEIWDIRSSTETKSRYTITAHRKTIMGIDWSYEKDTELLTSSLDNKIKFWSTDDTNKCKTTLNTGAPTYRALYTPTGSGVVAFFSQINDNEIKLWNVDPSIPDQDPNNIPVVFPHSDSVTSFAWRKSGSRNQLLSWGKDNFLNCWEIPDCLDFKNDDIVESYDGFGSPSKSQPTQVKDLEQEFAHIHLANIKGVRFKDLNTVKRLCIAVITKKNKKLKLRVIFPTHYPHNSAPSFEVMQDNIPQDLKKRLLETLASTSQICVANNKVCLESCLRAITNELEEIEEDVDSLALNIEDPKTDEQSIVEEPDTNIEEDEDINILKETLSLGEISSEQFVPFPRISGASFCGNGNLVFFSNFSRSMSTLNFIGYKEDSDINQEERTYNDFKQIMSEITNTPLVGNVCETLSGYFYTPEATMIRRKKNATCLEQNKLIPQVRLHNFSNLLGLSKVLGQLYTLSMPGKSTTNVCKQNEIAASSLRRKDLIKTWRLLQIITEPPTQQTKSMQNGFNKFEIPWALHPFARPLINSLFNHYEKMGDIQTLAMISCVLSLADKNTISNYKKNVKSEFKSYSPPEVDNGGKLRPSTSGVFSQGNNYSPYKPKDARSPKMQEELEKDKRNTWFSKLDEIQKMEHAEKSTLSDPEKASKYDQYCICYADILHRWGFLDKRAEVLRCVTNKQILVNNKQECEGISIQTACSKCKAISKNEPFCKSCNQNNLKCSICNIPIKGLSLFCWKCGHGGHPQHIKDWFNFHTNTHKICPIVDCRCECGLNDTKAEA